MLKSRITKAVALALSMSLMLAIPAYAAPGNSQIPQQNGFNNLQYQQGNMKNNGQLGNAAQFMINKGIIKGNATGDYGMSNKVKRGDMSVMLVRAFNFNTQSNSNGHFSDVSKNSYYYDAVNTLKILNIANGNGNNFNPNNNLTLQEAIWFVERALDSSGYDYDEGDLEDLFEDRSLSDYATREDICEILYAVLGDDIDLDDIENIGITEADRITYETDEDTAVTFDEDDFNEVCEDATDETLSYVKFTLPSSSYGKLYYDYASSSDYDSKVASTERYYYDADSDELSISDVTFVPKSNYTGTVKINYTGYNTDGDSFTGTIRITVD